MNSSFKIEDDWTASPFNLGTPVHIAGENLKNKKGSSPLKLQQRLKDDEIQIYIEPTLFVQRVIDPVNKRLSSVIEHLPIESQLITITSERVTPQLLAKEAKCKRLLEEEEEEEEARILAEEEAKVAQKRRKRRISQDQEVNGVKRQKIDPQVQDTVLVRLSSGQVVRVPRAILKKVGSINTPIPPTKLTPETPKAPAPTPAPSLEPDKLEFPLKGRLNELLHRLSGVKEEVHAEDTKEKIILNGILEKLAKSANGVRAIKIRAFQGGQNNVQENEFGTASLFSQLEKVVRLTDPIVQTANDRPQGVTKITIPPAISVTMKSPIKCVKLTSPTKQSLQLLQPRPPVGHSPKVVFHTLPMSEAIKVISPYMQKGGSVMRNGVSGDRKTLGTFSLSRPSEPLVKLPSNETLKPVLHLKSDLKPSPN